MILDGGKSGGFLDPNVCLVKLDDVESSLKWGEWWWSEEQENICIFLVFQARGSLEDRMISEIFLLIILWEDKSKFLLGAKIFFNELVDEVEGRWLCPVLKRGKDLAGGINAGDRSSLGLLADLEEEEWESEWLMLIEEIALELSFNSGRH